MLGALAALPALPTLLGATSAETQTAAPLASWNDGPAKQAILDFIRATTDPSSPTFVKPEERIATFDQDGTLWVEHPIYTQVVYCFDRVPAVAKAKPELANEEPFKTVLSGDRAAIAKLSMDDLLKIATATLTGMDVDTYRDRSRILGCDSARCALEAALHRSNLSATNRAFAVSPREWLQDLHRDRRRTGFRARLFGADYGIPPEQIVGTAGGLKYEYAPDGKPELIKEPKLILNDNNAGKPEGIQLMIGRRPHFAFGNSTGDREMLEYTKAGDGARLAMIVLHDDAKREYAYGPAQGLPDTKVGTFTQGSTTRRRRTAGSSSA